MDRREALLLMTSFPMASVWANQENHAIDPAIIHEHDAALQNLLDKQITDPTHRGFGSYPDQWELYHCGAAANVLEQAVTGYVIPQSKFHQNKSLLQRMQWAVDFLVHNQSPDGSIDLLTTNFKVHPVSEYVH